MVSSPPKGALVPLIPFGAMVGELVVLDGVGNSVVNGEMSNVCSLAS
jgi:hypothetical protein